MDVRDKLYEIVKARRLMWIELGKATGLDWHIISLSLRGKRQLYADEFLTLCKALELDANEFKDCGGNVKCQRLKEIRWEKRSPRL